MGVGRAVALLEGKVSVLKVWPPSNPQVKMGGGKEAEKDFNFLAKFFSENILLRKQVCNKPEARVYC